MPLLRQLQNDLKQYILAILCAGTFGYGVYEHRNNRELANSLEKKLSKISSQYDSRVGSVEKKVEECGARLSYGDGVSSAQNSRLSEFAEEFSKQGARVKSLEDNLYLPDRRPIIDSTVQVLMFKGFAKKKMSSGTIICSRLNKDLNFDNYVLCTNHGVAGSTDGEEWMGLPTIIKVRTYKNLVSQSLFEAEIVATYVSQDWSLLKFESKEKLPCAKLASEDRIKSIDTFCKVLTVGCPLGVPPVKTDGEVYSKAVIPGGRPFWLITTPVVNGNSGGGVYVSSSNELIGMVNECGSIQREQGKIPVYHMGLMTNFAELRNWLDKEKLSFIYKD